MLLPDKILYHVETVDDTDVSKRLVARSGGFCDEVFRSSVDCWKTKQNRGTPHHWIKFCRGEIQIGFFASKIFISYTLIFDRNILELAF